MPRIKTTGRLITDDDASENSRLGGNSGDVLAEGRDLGDAARMSEDEAMLEKSAPSSGSEASDSHDDKACFSRGDESARKNSDDDEEAALGDDPPPSPNFTFFIGKSKVTKARIKEMEKRKFFPPGYARSPGEETEPSPRENEAVVFVDFFVAGL